MYLQCNVQYTVQCTVKYTLQCTIQCTDNDTFNKAPQSDSIVQGNGAHCTLVKPKSQPHNDPQVWNCKWQEVL